MTCRNATIWILLVAFSAACSNPTAGSALTEPVQDEEANAVQSALGSANSEANAAEGGVVVRHTRVTLIDDLVDGSDRLAPRTTSCTYSSVRSACTSSQDQITWGGCTVFSGRISMLGGWLENFSGTSAGTCATPLVSGETVVRTSSASIMSIANSFGTVGFNGTTLTTDTSGGRTYDGTVLLNTGNTTTATGASPTIRSVTLAGVHHVLRGPLGGIWFDHYVTTTSNLSMQGSRATSNRVINSGTVVVYHQVAKYKATSVFSSVTWGSASCCFPTSGTIATTFSGSLTDTSTLDFTPGATTCGQATYTNSLGVNKTLTLSQCN